MHPEYSVATICIYIRLLAVPLSRSDQLYTLARIIKRECPAAYLQWYVQDQFGKFQS